VTDDFTTTDSFLEGKGKKFKAGADVGIVAVKNGESVTYKYNVFANFVDLSAYMQLVNGATTGNLAKFKADGSVEDTGVAAGDVLTKVSGATSGDLAGLDGDGKPTDTGIKATDVSTHLSDTTKHITSDERTAWNGAAHIYASETQPEGLKNGDLWLQIYKD
jgi:hypothetical protein